jgi:hypothetical protein
VYAGVEVLCSCLAKAQCLMTPNFVCILGVQDKSVSCLSDKVKGWPLCAILVSSNLWMYSMGTLTLARPESIRSRAFDRNRFCAWIIRSSHGRFPLTTGYEGEFRYTYMPLSSNRASTPAIDWEFDNERLSMVSTELPMDDAQKYENAHVTHGLYKSVLNGCVSDTIFHLPYPAVYMAIRSGIPGRLQIVFFFLA